MYRQQRLVIALVALLASNALALSAPDVGDPPRTTAANDDAPLVTLAGNTRPEASPANDRGMVPDRMPLAHLQLLLRRPAPQEEALDRTIEALHVRASLLFHQWLNARELG